MASTQVAYLGPMGTYSHLIVEKRFGTSCKAVPLPTILDICTFVSKGSDRMGVVPIENSSGGTIYETVDILLASKPKVFVTEELSLEVKLALIGCKGERIKVLYSHFAPLEHAIAWVKRHLPKVEKRVVVSTAAAAQRAAAERHAAALGSRKLAPLYDLDVIHYPVQADIPNITSFLVIAGRKRKILKPTKTTLAVRLPNKPGSLCTFLEKFRDENVDLSRLISRPLRGRPREYAFLVDIAGSSLSPPVKRALKEAGQVSMELRVVGSYPSRRRYKS